MTDVSTPQLVIYSPEEAAVSEGGGFWCNDLGWVDFNSATRFSEPPIRLPMGNSIVFAIYWEAGE